MPKIGSAPAGENSSPAGTEKIPLTGSQWASLTTIRNWLKTYFDTLYATLGSVATDGWIAETATWTYVSASTFTVPGDLTAKYQKGTKLKFTQTTVKYAVVASSSYAAGNTTVTIVVSTDYVVANAAISATYFSYSGSPQGFPDWFNFTTTPGGFSGTPTVTAARWKASGLMFHVQFQVSGTSNATTFTLTTPVVAKATGASAFQYGALGFLADNGVNGGPGVAEIQANTTTLALYRSGYAAWTGSGTKSAYLHFLYEW